MFEALSKVIFENLKIIFGFKPAIKHFSHILVNLTSQKKI